MRLVWRNAGGKSDISIFASALTPGASRWGAPQRLSNDPAHSEQNPVIFTAPDGTLWLFHTAQPSGNQDECRIRMARVVHDPATPEKLSAEDGRFLDLPKGCFIRAPLRIRDDGAWLLPIFRCVQRPGQKWNGSHDTAALGISKDNGLTWQLQELAGSTGCVHMSPVAGANGRYSAFFAAVRPISFTARKAQMAVAHGQNRCRPTYRTIIPPSPRSGSHTAGWR